MFTARAFCGPPPKQLPGRLKHNVPVQVDRAKLAIRLGDRPLFEEAIASLAATRIDPGELADSDPVGPRRKRSRLKWGDFFSTPRRYK